MPLNRLLVPKTEPMNFYKPPASIATAKTNSLNLYMRLNRLSVTKTESTNLYKLPSLAAVKSDSVNVYMLLPTNCLPQPSYAHN